MTKEEMREGFLWFCGQHFDFVHSGLTCPAFMSALNETRVGDDHRLILFGVAEDGGPIFDATSRPIAAACIVPRCNSYEKHVAHTILAYIAKHLGTESQDHRELYRLLGVQAAQEGLVPPAPEAELVAADTMMRTLLAIYAKGEAEHIQFIFRDKPLALAQQVRFLMWYALLLVAKQATK